MPNHIMAKRRSLTFSAEASLVEILFAIAAHRGVSASACMRDALSDWVDTELGELCGTPDHPDYASQLSALLDAIEEGDSARPKRRQDPPAVSGEINSHEKAPDVPSHGVQAQDSVRVADRAQEPSEPLSGVLTL